MLSWFYYDFVFYIFLFFSELLQNMRKLSLDIGKALLMSYILIIGYCEPSFVIVRGFFHKKNFEEDITRSFSVSLLPVFFSLRRIVMRARRHVIINANTQFLLCAFYSVFRERENRSRKRKSNVGREHWRKQS